MYAIRIVKVIILVFCANVLMAGEGMWLPLLLKALNEQEMQDMGMKMTAEDIYSVNKGSLKDAIVHFNGGCTSELISDEGLLLTNHHCGYGQIQSHSTLENNYLRDGFWAMNKSEELPNPGTVATFIVSMEDVTEQVLNGVKDNMTSKERQSAIDKNLDAVKSGKEVASYDDVMVKPFYKGNQYFLFVTRTYKDVRMVGAPPESIGKFGSDTDNWVWPRHTGDFSLFRIYAGPDNLPAEYSKENKPFKPKHFLPISMDGIEEGDFTLVFGFPGRTNQYLPSYAVEQTVDVLNPAKIGIRETALNIIDKYMRQDEKTRIQYASKFARVANYWKKWIGESTGIKATDGVGKKHKLEKSFTEKVSAKKKTMIPYREILPRFEKLYKDIEPYALSRDMYNEIVFRNVELLRNMSYLGRLVSTYENNGVEGYNGYKNRLSGYMGDFFKNYNSTIDKEVFAALIEKYTAEVPIAALSDPLVPMLRNGYEGLANSVYDNTMFTNAEATNKVFAMAPEKAIEAIKNDPAYHFSKTLTEAYNKNVEPKYTELNTEISDLQRIYMKALMEVFPEKRFFPDANSTMRISYGKVNGYIPRDAVYYTPVTYLDGVMAKYKPGDYEFDVPEKLRELHSTKDYGPYAEDGKMPVCFIGSNHTTGGNSGSPAIDAHGNLIGLNFDRVWEGTMSDINYDPSICRNIMVDIRYVLFIVDKYAGAGHLVEEMKLVNPKKKMHIKKNAPKK